MLTTTKPKKKKSAKLDEVDKIDAAEAELTELTPQQIAAKAKQRERFVKSGYFFWALLLHIVLFALLWTFIIFRAPAPPQETKFMPVAIKQPPPPPVPPPPPGGDAANAEPNVVITPPPMTPSITAISTPSTFNVTTVKIPVPNLNMNITTQESGVKAGHGSGRGGHGFGGVGDIPGLLVGYLYDLKQTPTRGETGMTPSKYHDVLSQFISGNWDDSILTQYYKSPTPLSTAYIFIPTLIAEDGPQAFKVQNEVKPNMYVVLYKGTVAPTQDGTYHFVGVGDDICAVRAGGQTVYDGSASINGGIWSGYDSEQTYHMPNFTPSWGGDANIKVGTPLQLSAGQKIDIEVLIGEQPGGHSNYFIMIQRDEDLPNYKKDGDAPILPIFQLDEDPITIDVPRNGVLGGYPPYAPTPVPWKGYGQ